ncbi:MAG: hypothetical protein II623_12875, partial [Paludibacteraceae bacterium]|nr:hypothetical protein [Paludibacteraceae bacterium]
MDTYNPVPVSENAVDAFSQNLYNEKIQQIREKVAGVIIGQEFATDLILTALLANGHVMVEGVPGVAKTLTARLIAKLVDVIVYYLRFHDFVYFSQKYRNLGILLFLTDLLIIVLNNSLHDVIKRSYIKELIEFGKHCLYVFAVVLFYLFAAQQ